MKFFGIFAVLALATAAYALPADDLGKRELEKRATCTAFGIKYFCTGTPTPTPTPTPKPTTAKTTATTPLPTNTGGSSSSGKSTYSGGNTASDITDNNGCTPLTVIFARGTSESGNVGSVAGPPMFKQLLSDLGASGVTLQGVNYPASSAGNANCGADGGSDMASLVTTILGRCPNTKIALSGYSQGACVVHNAVQSQGLSASDIDAVVLFGDPFNGQSVGSIPSSKVLEICYTGDSICNHGSSSGSGNHLSYGSNGAQAATFIENTTGV